MLLLLSFARLLLDIYQNIIFLYIAATQKKTNEEWESGRALVRNALISMWASGALDVGTLALTRNFSPVCIRPKRRLKNEMGIEKKWGKKKSSSPTEQ